MQAITESEKNQSPKQKNHF